MYHVARVHTTWDIHRSVKSSHRVIHYALQLTALISHHVQPRSRGRMTRSSPFPRRFLTKTVTQSQQVDATCRRLHTHSPPCPTNGSKSESKGENLFSGSKREREGKQTKQTKQIFLGAYDNLLERETQACNSRNATNSNPRGGFLGSTTVQVVSFF